MVGDHGGNQAAQAAVAAKLNGEWAGQAMTVLHVADYYVDEAQIAYLREQGETPATIGSHAGLIDTSELLAVHPQGIDLSRLAALPLRSEPTGHSGDPMRASAAYGKALVSRKVYEEALEALSAVRPDDVVDPAAYFFHKAVAAHALMQRKEADDTINRLLDDVADAPERYKMVAALMHFDMLTWQDKDLGWIARKMDVIQRRLDLTRGGKKTQQMQKEVLVRLDELIKEKENQQKNNSGNGGC